MAEREITKFRDDLIRLLRHVVETLDGLSEAQVNWRPPAKGANSLLVIATHTVGAAEAHVLDLLAGQRIDRVRADEFKAAGSGDALRHRLPEVITRITSTFNDLEHDELDKERMTPGGRSTGREVLLWALMHASGHLAAAQLTRDLVVARESASLRATTPAETK